MVRDATSAWAAMTHDPVGVLLPAAGTLLVDVALSVGLREAWLRGAIGDAAAAAGTTGEVGFAVALGVVVIARPILQAPFRAAMLTAGARAVAAIAKTGGDGGDAGVLATLRLAFVDAIRGVASALLAAVVLGPTALLGSWLVTRGLYLFAAIIAGAGLILAAALALVGRAALAYAPVDVVVGRRGAFASLQRAYTELSPDIVVTLGFLLVGDVLTGLGGALCAAGALPGYPLSELALVSRWSHARASAAPASVAGAA